MLTQPGIIGGIHREYLEAGADILETCTFNSTSVSQADYNLTELVYELNFEGARLARQLCDEFTAANPAKPRFVAGVLGPTSRTASISPDVNDPGYRNVAFDELVANYFEAITGLVEGGADILLVETVFDTLNAKAALFAIEAFFERAQRRWPVMISGTITDASGRTLSGQTAEAFWNSLNHIQPLIFGLNCALGAKELRQYVEELSRVCDCYVSAHPNAGLPNAFGGYDETADMLADEIEGWARSGIVNIVGGCCGTSPEHIEAIAERVATVNPRKVPKIEKKLRLSGLEPFNVGADSLYVNVGERTNVTGSKAFARMILEGRFDDALAVARQQVENGAQVIDINMDEAMLDSDRRHGPFPQTDRLGTGHFARADHDRLVEMGSHRSRPQVHPGQGHRQFDLDEGRRSQVHRAGQTGPPLRRRGHRHGLRREGPGRHLRPQDRDFEARLRPAD